MAFLRSEVSQFGSAAQFSTEVLVIGDWQLDPSERSQASISKRELNYLSLVA
jgi:hypothetical protein